MPNITETLNVILSNRKIVIHSKESFCNRYPQNPGSPTAGCPECGLGEFFGKVYNPATDYVTLDGDYRAFKQKAAEGTASITLLGGEMLQDIVTKTPWPSVPELSLRYGIKPETVQKLIDYRIKIGKPIQEGEPMEMWERDALLPTAMIKSLHMIPHITSNFDIFRPKNGKQENLEEIISQLKIAGINILYVSWHTTPGSTLSQNKRYFDHLVSAIKYCERVAKIPTVLNRVFRGFKADPDIFLWQREVANRYITNDISPAGIRSADKDTIFYSGNQEMRPSQEEIELLELFHLLNAMAGDQPRLKTVFQSIFEGVLAQTGWRCNPDKEYFEFIDVTADGVRSGVCSEVRGKVAHLFPQDSGSRMSERVNLIRELCPSCLSRCYTYFEWRDFQKDALHLWHYAQAAGKIWRQMYGREKPFRHLVMNAQDYENPDLLSRILQFRFRYFASTLENTEVVAMLKRSGVDPLDPLQKYYQEARNPAHIITTLQKYLRGLPELADEKSLQSRIFRQVARIKHIDPSAAPIPWKYIWILRKENNTDLSHHYEHAQAVLENREKLRFPREGTILALIKSFFYPPVRLRYIYVE